MKIKLNSRWTLLSKYSKSKPNYSALDYIADVFHRLWVKGLLLLLFASFMICPLSETYPIIEKNAEIILGAVWLGYILILFVGIILIIIIEPFTKKSWRKIEVISNKNEATN